MRTKDKIFKIEPDLRVVEVTDERQLDFLKVQSEMVEQLRKEISEAEERLQRAYEECSCQYVRLDNPPGAPNLWTCVVCGSIRRPPN